MAMAAARAAINARNNNIQKEREQDEIKKNNKHNPSRLDDVQRKKLIKDLNETTGMKYIAMMAMGKVIGVLLAFLLARTTVR